MENTIKTTMKPKQYNTTGPKCTKMTEAMLCGCECGCKPVGGGPCGRTECKGKKMKGMGM